MADDELYIDLLDDRELSELIAIDANFDEREERATSTKAKEPYGPPSKAKYADPGKQGDSKKRYPLDTEAHVRAAWSYINMPKNAAKYSSEQLAAIKSKIKAAAKRMGIEISSDKKSERSGELPMIETRAATVRDVDFGQRIITVIAVPYEQPAKIMYRQEIWDEVFERSAFNGLAENQRRIPVNREHNPEHIVGKIINAQPEREEGLVTEVKISRTDRGDETLALAEDDVLSASAGFMVKTPHRDQILDTRNKVRRITRAFLDHLAFVGTPAYEGAKIMAMRNPDTSTMSEADLPPLVRPLIDEWMNDPLLRWASDRFK